MKFGYWVELKEGFKQTSQLEEETDVNFVIEAKNRATADRMVRAMLKDAPNVVEYSGICIDD